MSTSETTNLPVALAPGVVTAALRTSGILTADGAVCDVRARPVGHGHMGDSYLVECGYEPGVEGPSRLFAKLPATDPTSAALDQSIGAYAREHHMYSQVLPAMTVATPRFLGSLQVDGHSRGLLLQDLSEMRGFDQIEGAPPDAVGSALNELPRLHAGCWDHPTYGAQEWLFNRFGRLPELLKRYESSWAELGDVVGSGFSDAQMGVIERFGVNLLDWASKIGGPHTVVHQDLRLDNMLFGQGRAWLLDWQVAGWASPAADLVYLISTSVDPEVRRAGERSWLRGYLQGLADLGVDWGWEEAWEAYRYHCFYTLLGLIPSMGHVKRTDRGLEMYRAMLDRATTQILDLDAVEFLNE